jgi:hypothetical protein
MFEIEIPSFHHPEIAQLYQYGFEIPHTVIKEILALPRTTLIADLDLVIDHLIDRRIYYVGVPYNPQQHTFPVHAMLLLGALEASESISTLFHIYTQKQEFNDFWLKSWFAEAYWLPMFWCGKDQLTFLASIIGTATPHSSIGHKVVLEALLQIGLHYEDKKLEVQMTVHILLNNAVKSNDKSAFGIDLMNSLLYCVGQLRIEVAIPWVLKCYDEDLADFDEAQWEELSFLIVGSKTPHAPKEIPKDIYAFYDFLLTKQLESDNLLPKTAETLPKIEKIDDASPIVGEDLRQLLLRDLGMN